MLAEAIAMRRLLLVIQAQKHTGARHYVLQGDGDGEVDQLFLPLGKIFSLGKLD